MKAVIHAPGAAGIIYDLPDHELPPEAWTAGQNVAFRNGSVEKFKGESQVFGTPSGDPYWLLQAFSPGVMYWLYPSLTNCYVTDGLTHKDITKAATTYGADADTGWNGGVVGGVPILNNGVDAPQMWDRNFATPGKLVDLTNWPASTTAKVLRPFKNYLIGMDMTESGTRFEDVLRWSHPAVPGAVPSTWDYTDATKDAGRTALADTPGAIIDGATLGNLFIIYKEQGVYGMQEIASRQIFRVFQMFSQLSALSRHCIKAVAEQQGRRHLVLTSDADLVVHDGTGARSVVEAKWRRWLQANIDGTNYQRSYIAIDRSKREAWVCFPTNGSTFADMALILDLKDGTISNRELPPAKYAEWGVVEGATEDETWDADAEEWDLDNTTWDERSFSARNLQLILAGSTKILRAGHTEQFDGANMTSYVERSGLALIGRRRDGAPIVDFQSRKLLRRIWLEMESTGPVNIYAVTQEQKGGPVTYTGPVSFDPATQKFVDIVASGRTLGIKIESIGNISWKLDGYELIFERLGVH